MTKPLAFFALSLLSGCVPRIGGDAHDAGRRDAEATRFDGGFPSSSGAFVHAISEDGIVTTVDATDTDAWQRLDLDTGLTAPADEGWDLAFSRFRVRTNGGVSGRGGVLVARLPGQRFETLTRAPEEGWTADLPGEGTHENAFNGGPDGANDWYDYDVAAHMLTPRDVTYVVASTAARFYKLRFLGYYDAAGTPAVVRFVWAEIDPPRSALPDAGPSGPLDGGVVDGGPDPRPDTTLTVDASNRTDWVYVRLGVGVVTSSDPTRDHGWDLAFRRTEIRTCSGTSGPGLGGARLAPSELGYDDVAQAGTLGYVEDEVAASDVPGSEPTSRNLVLADWYDYDAATHTVRPGARAYLVRTADGGYAKLRIWRWNNGVYELSFEVVERRPEIVELEVDARAEVRVDLRSGAIAAEGRWDLAISGARLATNGGASGPGMGAAVDTGVAELDVLAHVPTSGWVIDASAETGNAVLATWRDPETLAARPTVFAIRTADGNAAAIRIVAHESGVYRIALTYAGPGQTRFF